MILEVLAQIDLQTAVPQYGFGGVALYLLVKWLDRIEKVLERILHSQTSQNKTALLMLAQHSDSGSFVHEEAKKELGRLEEKQRIKDQT